MYVGMCAFLQQILYSSFFASPFHVSILGPIIIKLKVGTQFVLYVNAFTAARMPALK